MDGDRATDARHPLWGLASAPSAYVLENVRVILPDEVLAGAAIVVEDGRIARLDSSAGAARGPRVDGGGLLLAPGFIDVHSDALEREREPRPGAPVPGGFALASFEGRAAAAGITTVFHGAGFQHRLARGRERSVEEALGTCAAVDAIRSNRVDHRILHRLDLLSEPGAAALSRRFDALGPASPPPLVSYEDHSPGQGQYASIDVMRRELVDTDGLSEAQADARLAWLQDEARAKADVREANLDWLHGLARAGAVRLLGHDPDTADAVDALHAGGGSVAEFPTTIDAARRARRLGMPVVAGGPNAVRGESHSGNVSAAALVAEGLVDALASDYMPSTLLGGVHALVRDGVVDLPRGIGLVTSGPARVAGLGDRGTIRVGARADFALIDDSLGEWPRVAATLFSGSASGT